MRHPFLVGLLSISLGFLAQRAEAGLVHFIGGHPIGAKHGGGYCYIDAPHIHAYAPDRPQLYQRVGDDYVFTADPTPFGYEGEKHTYYGNHPIVQIGAEPVFCYLDGPHSHIFAPPDVPDYQVKDGVAFYVGAYPPAYARMKGQRRKLVNAEYRPYVAMRPVVEVQPPPAWQGEVWVAPPAVEVRAPGVAVSAPGVVASAPGVVVGAPGVVVAPPRVTVAAPSVTVAAPGVYVAPPPRVVVRGPQVGVVAPGVVVAAPGVVVGAPVVSGTVVVGGGRRGHDYDDDDDRGHHDNGKHKGWYKHGRGHD